MGISFAPKVVVPATTVPQTTPRRSGNVRPLAVDHIDLHQPDMRLRTGHVLTLLGISAPTLHARIKAGKIPKADGRDPRPFWRAQTISAYLGRE